MPVVSDHSGLAEVAVGLGDAARTFDGSASHLAWVLEQLLSLPAAERQAAGARGRERVVERWSWERIAGRLVEGLPQSGEDTPP